MPFNTHDYLDLAKELAGVEGHTGGKEARHRSAISRAYYAVMIYARAEAARRGGISFPRRNTHAWTIDRWKKDPDPLAKKIGSRLKRLKNRRVMADYDTHVKNLDKELRSALKEADELWGWISELP
ncbi:MAG: HEPN domain-containing protein [Bacteroidota bacterium]